MKKIEDLVEPAPPSFIRTLERMRHGDKPYEEFIMQAHALERLLSNPDFKVYQEVLREAYLLLVAQIHRAPAADLLSLQGALYQHSTIIDLPRRIVGEAANVIANRREAEESANG